jgi:hypothetical protein
VIAQVGRAYRAHWRVLLAAGLVVFAPLGVLEVLADHLEGPLDDQSGELDPGLIVALGVALIGLTFGTLAGEVVYTGIVSALVHGSERGDDVSVGAVVRRLPIGRLIAIDLLWVAMVIVGFIALIVPGFLFMTWFALVAPAAEIEDLGVRASFRRSRELVRRRFWLVLVFVVVLLLAEAGLTSAATSISFWGIGHGDAGDWLATVLASLAISPLYALVAVIVFLRLREFDPSR